MVEDKTPQHEGSFISEFKFRPQNRRAAQKGGCPFHFSILRTDRFFIQERGRLWLLCHSPVKFAPLISNEIFNGADPG
jgi:hypothetical protein